ncbi:hypothetical protein H9079_004806, partial [Salmonella enterica]|nr:hypothetical protein [Salmonella enterica]
MINQTILKEEFNIRYSMAGYEFNLRENLWNLKRNVIINLSFMDGFLEKNYHEGFIHTLAYFAQIHKPESVSSFIVKIKAIMFGYNVRTFSEHELITAYSDLQRKDYGKFIMFKRFIIKWKELGYFGIDDNAYEYLKVITIPTSIHGDVVKRRDPKLGPFNDLEIKMIVDGLETGIKQGIVSEYCYIFTRILLLSGRRPIQIMSLKHRDVIKNERGYFLRIPRAKQKNNVFRGAFREIEVTEDIWQHLMKVIIHNINKVKEIITED